MFPSPHGDKFQLLHLGEDEKVVLFPSPHGDKFQQVTSIILDSLFEFPSPHGDKFQPERASNVERKHLFPSPHGDKFQLLDNGTVIASPMCFRPLTGINFNSRTKRFCPFLRVSVPSRG